MVELSFIVGLVGNIISILVFTSPIATFRRVVKKKSTENFKGIPYITTLLSTSLWTFYGLLKPGGLLVVTVNGVGSVLQAIYVILFLIYAPKDTRVKLAKIVAILNIGCYGGVILITLLAIHGSVRLVVIGVMCAVLTVGMYASPMGAMRRVVKTRSVEYMPFSLSFFLFLNGGVWSAYALLVKDFFIGVPNAIGFVLGSAQLVLYTVYRSSKSFKSVDSVKDEKVEEEGSAHLVGRVEMQKYSDGDDDRVKSDERQLSKGSSLPKGGSVSRQHSLQKIVKARTFTPSELRSIRVDIDG
ncbi:Bidirectional sugar transporter SWEET16 [Acorus calamus]|uniref:Bidirectional sugar transporter SWEET n=1 Tax=Acorus calamus TaxID=4465 RepID=A0AAV9CUE2_ACOCL|nr:Bidirectional sugar transporter SWEET16 [Acorus calamus]